MNPKFPVYIVSKNRWESLLTARVLEYLKVPFHIVVETQEYLQYAKGISPEKILVLPQKYIDDYDTFWPKEDDNRVGPGAARNFVWQHSIDRGFDWHWVMDDNLDSFYRLNRNMKARVDSGTIFKCMEDYVLRYSNVAIAGPNYAGFCKSTDAVPATVFNTRIYSCLLIRNDIPYRWRGRYNEDTDLSLRVLKDGWCTVQFNAFLQGKVTTQRMRGGNTKEFYKPDGTILKSKILEDMHPDVCSVVWKFNRWHHHVDYRPFSNNILERVVDVPQGINEYGMTLRYAPDVVIV